jgi:hypothetical protein
MKTRIATHGGTNGMLQKLAVFAALVLVLLLPGCSTPSAGGGRTLKQTEMDVSWPMTRFRNGVAAGRVTQGEQEQVNSLYSSFRAAYQEALKAANNDGTAPAPDNVKALATQVIGAIQAIPF